MHGDGEESGGQMVDAESDSIRLFVALVPPVEIQTAVRQYQHHIRDRYHSRAALKSPPHITLQPPFTWPRADLPALVTGLAAFAHTQVSVRVELCGFAAFSPRVLYIDVVRSDALSTLRADLLHYLEDQWAIASAIEKKRAFVPHLTIGFRDLTQTQFALAWQELQDQPFAATFVAEALTLLVHDGQCWQICAHFPCLADVMP